MNTFTHNREFYTFKVVYTLFMFDSRSYFNSILRSKIICKST